MKIILEFDTRTIEATLNDSPVAHNLYKKLPLSFELTTWGDEAYGSAGIDFGEHTPIPEIPEGGIAFTNNGNFLCFFYGQRPAWPVEYIGDMSEDWKELKKTPPVKVCIRK